MEDYKEKLRLAREALDSGSYDKETIEYIFPELKESEDERIRKQLLNWFKDCKWDAIDNETLKRDDIIAWLEKQGEKIDAIENLDTEFEKQVSHLIASAINKEHEYNQSYVKWTANALLNYAKHELEKQGEQNPAWSEEDEKIVSMLVSRCNGTTYTYDILIKMKIWLKSIKERMKGE